MRPPPRARQPCNPVVIHAVTSTNTHTNAHDTDPTRRIERRLRFVYGHDAAPSIARDVQSLIARYRGRIPAQATGWSQRDALLITYADTLHDEDAPPLRALRRFMNERVGERFSFVHLLPFYPYSSDDGFAVQDFRQVRPDLGTWDDVRALAADHRLVFDAVINHVSASSIYMDGYTQGDPQYDDFFISLDPETDTSSVLRTRDTPLLHDYTTARGTEWLWTTFSRDQVDLNFANPRVLIEILDVLLYHAQQGAAMLRLDAIPYLWKQLGTSCAHLPQTHELIKLIRDVFDAAAPHVLLLTETNVPHEQNISYFGDRGDEAQMIYNFPLAPLIVWSFFAGETTTLTDWARRLEWISPRATYLNITATHDGIGMRPTEGILAEEHRMALCQMARDRGGDVTGKRNADGSLSPYELNLSYFDAINDPRTQEPMDVQVRRFLCTQAIPMALIGMPGLYIHSLIGSRNDDAGVQRTGRARSINRPQLNRADLDAQLSDPDTLRSRVFDGITALLEQRARVDAFHPDARQQIHALDPGVFAVERRHPNTGQTALALHNVTEQPRTVALPAPAHRELLRSPAEAPELAAGDTTCTLAPYDVRWLEVSPNDA